MGKKKGGKSGGGGGGGGDELRVKEKLEAVLLADSFRSAFRPITFDTPKALIPVVNTPLIDYTIEFLARNNVEKIFVFCRAHADAVEKHFERRKDALSGVSVEVIRSQHCFSVGDVLREVLQQERLKGDFILIGGDVISNMRLDKALRAHKRRREKDKSAIMTMVFKKCAPTHRLRVGEHPLVAVVHEKTSQLLHYEGASGTRINLPPAMLDEMDEVTMRNDLMDCEIYIGSQEFLIQFADNFDYHNISDLVRGILSNEIMGDKLFAHVLDQEYGAVVGTLRAYDLVSRDVMKRWAYPLVPDNNWTFDTTYGHLRTNVYKEAGVHLARSCTVGSNVCIGEGTVVGAHTEVRNSVIGKNCVIGTNVVLDGAYIWDNVRVMEGAHVHQALVASNSTLREGCKVTRGCVVSFGVTVGAHVELPPATRCALEAVDSDDDDDFGSDGDDAHTPAAHTSDVHLGADGVGCVWGAGKDTTTYSIGDQPTAEAIEDDEDEESDEEDEEEGPELTFADEVHDTVVRGITEHHSSKDILLELNSLKFAYDENFLSIVSHVLPTFLAHVASGNHGSVKEMLVTLKRCVTGYKHLVMSFTKFLDDTAMVKLVLSLQAYCTKSPDYQPLFLYVLKMLYDVDVLPEETVLGWWHTAPDNAQKEQCRAFITWLEEASEESSEEESD